MLDVDAVGAGGSPFPSVALHRLILAHHPGGVTPGSGCVKGCCLGRQRAHRTLFWPITGSTAGG